VVEGLPEPPTRIRYFTSRARRLLERDREVLERLAE
jgi:hypothetical protein